MIENFSHITINCRSLELSIKFYQILGLTVTRVFEEAEIDASGVSKAFLLPPGRLRVAHLLPPEPSENMRIDLVEWIVPATEGSAYASLNNPGLARLCFRVKDLAGTVQTLMQKGISFLSEIQPLGLGIHTVCLRDPDGTFIQFIEGLKQVLQNHKHT